MNTIPNSEFKINKKEAYPISAGCNTNFPPAQLPLGAKSYVFNCRPSGNGLELRSGVVPHNETAESALLSLYQFKKGRSGNKYFFAQTEAGGVLQADETPPTDTSGDFGDSVHSDTSFTALPASWAAIEDMMLFSQGSGQHQTFIGTDQQVKAVFYKIGTQTARILNEGIDYTEQCRDPDSTYVTGTITLDDSDLQSLYVCTQFPADSLKWDLGTPDVGSFTPTVYSFRVGGWNALTITDGTSGFTQDGTMSWTRDTSEVPTYMFGVVGYWYRIRVTTGTDCEFTVASLTYGGGFEDLYNMWDGQLQYIIEAQAEQSDGTYQTYAGSTIVLGGLVTGDYLYFATPDPIWAVYVGVGATPNETASTAVSAVQGYVHSTGAGADWTAVTSVADQTGGLANSGMISWQQATTWTPLSFNGSDQHLYWWRIKWDHDLSSDCIISLQYVPIFDINKLGKTGNVNCAWKDRAVYTFKKFPRDLYVSAAKLPNSLNGDDFAILTPGDGRFHPVTAAVKFHNELMVFQEELGMIGGTITIFEGYNPASFGRYVLSTRIGTFHQKSVAVVEGNTVTTRRDYISQTVAFFLSHEGVFMTDGQTIQLISSDIQNYFDTDKPENIRRGYEKYMFLKLDSQKKVLRLGLVSGSSATACNVFPVYDIGTGQWFFDEYPTGMKLTDMAELEAGSGNIHTLQYFSSGTGRVYRGNTGFYDDIDGATPVYVDGGFTMEFNYGGNFLNIEEVVLRGTSNSKFTLTKDVYNNGSVDSSENETFVMTADDGGDTWRYRVLESIKLNHSFSLDVSWTVTAGQTPTSKCDLYDMLVDIQGESGLN